MKRPDKTIERVKKLGFSEPPELQIRTNPNTKISHTLEPLAVMLYDFITTRKFVCGKDYTRKDWDLARYWFQIEWPTEYYGLLD